MTPNPYQPPAAYQAPPVPGAAVAPVVNRTPFILAAVGAWLASAYWGLMTGIIGLGMAFGSTSGTQLLWPLVLIVLYALRGVQIFKGNPAAARGIILLHAVGAIAALLQAASGGMFIAMLQGFKVVINVFGAITAYLAYRSYTTALNQSVAARLGGR
jgi:hypothetical protein